MTRWFGWPQILSRRRCRCWWLAAPAVLLRGLATGTSAAPFLAALGTVRALASSAWASASIPIIVPHAMTIWEAAAPDSSLAFLLVGAAVLIPLILAYTAYAYWVFRGKVDAAGGYH